MPFEIANTEISLNTENNIFQRRDIVEMHNEVQHCLDSEFELLNGTSGDIIFYLKKSNVNVNDLFDRIESKELRGTLLDNLKESCDIWYENEASSLEKSAIFYKYIYSLESQLEEWSLNLFEIIEEMGYKVDHRCSLENIRRELINENSNNKLIAFSKEELKEKENEERFMFGKSVEDARKSNLKRVDKLFRFIEEVVYKLKKYRRGVSHTLDEVMYEDVNSDERLNSGIMNFVNLETEEKKIEKPREKKVILKRARKMLNKSIKTVTSLIPKKDIHCFIGGGEFTISGNTFNYKISKKENYKLVQKTSETKSIHIPYELDLYTKENEYLANLCITFRGCPILDQVLSVYLMITSGQEKEMLEKCNFYKSSDMVKENQYLKQMLPNKFEKKESNFSFSLEEEPEEQIERKAKRKIVAKRRSKFKEFVNKKLFRKIFEERIYDFVLNKEVSMDELRDYYSISRKGKADVAFERGGLFSENRLDFIIEENSLKGLYSE